MDSNDLFQFPCEFTIKIIGYNTEQFEIETLSIVRAIFSDLAETAITTREGKNKKYLAITVTVTANDREQLDLVYQNLTASQHVLMVL